MKITDILIDDGFETIISECSQFIEESQQQLLFRELPCSYSNIHKVKVRKKKSSKLCESFNRAFDELHPNIRQRSVFTYGDPDKLKVSSDFEPFAVFPIDGFKFIYNPKVTNSNGSNPITESGVSADMMADVLKFTYLQDNLAEGITTGAEIVLFNIPHFYAIRATAENLQALSAVGAV